MKVEHIALIVMLVTLAVIVVTFFLTSFRDWRRMR